MANDTKTSDLTEVFTFTGGLIEISMPIGGGNFESKWISQPSLVAILTAFDAQSTQTSKFKSKSSAFSEPFNADTKIESIDFVWVSGSSVAVKVGTSASGNDIISGRTVTSADNSFNPLGDKKTYFEGATTLHFTITGGAVDIIINFRNNYNS